MVWSSSSETEALHRLRGMGFSAGASQRAVDLAGGVDADTRAAAAGEWLLQHFEWRLAVRDGLACPPPEPNNPFFPTPGVQLTPISEDEPNIDDDHGDDACDSDAVSCDQAAAP